MRGAILRPRLLERSRHRRQRPSRGLRTAGLLLAGLAGCTPGRSVGSSGEAAPELRTVDPVVAPEPPRVPAVTARPIVIGWDAPVPRPTPAGAKLNVEALAQHRAGDYSESAAGFARALEASPGYVWARYNLACAHSRLGQLTEARAGLEALLMEDLPTFRPRLLKDEDLQALRDSATGAELIDTRLPKISAAYAESLQRGAPAMTYRSQTESVGELSGEGRSFRTPYTELRLGVYDDSIGRFVPMVPAVDQAYGGVLNVERGRAIVAHGQLAMKDMWEVQPHRARATVFSLQRWGESVQEVGNVSPSRVPFYGFELWLGGENTLFGTQHGLSYATSIDYLAWKGKRRRKIGWTGETGTGFEPEPPEQIPYAEPSVQVIDIAKAIYRRPHQATIRGRVVSHAELGSSVELGKGHHSEAEIIASADPLVFAVVSNATRFTLDGGEEDTPLTRSRHVVDRVDMGTGTVTRLAFGRGYAHVVWAPTGALFVDTLSGVSRYSPGSTEPRHDVVAGVRFGTPPLPEVGGV